VDEKSIAAIYIQFIWIRIFLVFLYQCCEL